MAASEPGPKLAVDESTPSVLISQVHFLNFGHADLQFLNRIHVDHQDWHDETAPSPRFYFWIIRTC
jgi:hypothetical protein